MQRRLPFVVLVAAAAATVVGVVVSGLLYGRIHEEAFAHLYTHPDTENPTHLHIDADITDGDPGRPCDPITNWDDVTEMSSATVLVGATHQIGVCIEDYDPNPVGAFELHVIYTGDPEDNDPPVLNLATEVDCADDPTGKCLDDNPDANDGDDPTGFKLGAGWDCSAFGITQPYGDDPTTPNVADTSIICTAPIAGGGMDLTANPGLLATIEFTAQGAGADVITIGTNSDVGAGRSCGDVGGEEIGCFGAIIHKAADIGIDKSVQEPVIAGAQAVFELAVTSSVAGAATGISDDLPNNLVYNDAATDAMNGADICNAVPDGTIIIDDGINVVVCAPVFPPQTVYIVADVPSEKAGVCGEVNWASTAGDPNTANDDSSVEFCVVEPPTMVSIGSGGVAPCEEDSVPLGVLNVPAPGVGTVIVDIVYDPAVVDPTAWVAEPGFDTVVCDLSHAADTIRCTATSEAGVVGDSLMANITFHCVGEPEQCSALDVAIVTFTDPATNDILVTDQDGQFCCIIPYDCRLEDDFGRGTALTFLENEWEFTWPPDGSVSGTGRVMRAFGRMILFGTGEGFLVFGHGTCPSGPGFALAINWTGFPVHVLFLQDTNGGS